MFEELSDCLDVRKYDTDSVTLSRIAVYLILLDKRACGDDIFHGLRGHILTHAQFKDVLDAVSYPQLALLVQCANVARAEPAVFEPLFVGLGVQQVLLTHTAP